MHCLLLIVIVRNHLLVSTSLHQFTCLAILLCRLAKWSIQIVFFFKEVYYRWRGTRFTVHKNMPVSYTSIFSIPAWGSQQVLPKIEKITLLFRLIERRISNCKECGNRRSTHPVSNIVCPWNSLCSWVNHQFHHLDTKVCYSMQCCNADVMSIIRTVSWADPHLSHLTFDAIRHHCRLLLI